MSFGLALLTETSIIIGAGDEFSVSWDITDTDLNTIMYCGFSLHWNDPYTGNPYSRSPLRIVGGGSNTMTLLTSLTANIVCPSDMEPGSMYHLRMWVFVPEETGEFVAYSTNIDYSVTIVS